MARWLSVVLLLALATACVGRESPDGDASASESDANPIVAAVRATRELRTARFEGYARKPDIQFSGDNATSLAGYVDFASDRMLLRTDWSASTLQLVLHDDTAFISMTEGDAEETWRPKIDTTWVRIDRDAITPVATRAKDLSALTHDPLLLVEILAGAGGSVEQQEAREVDGERMDLYTTVIQHEDLTPEAAAYLDIHAAGVALPVYVGAAVDADGRLRRLDLYVLSGPAPSDGVLHAPPQFSLYMFFSHLGEKDGIYLPPKRDVTDLQRPLAKLKPGT